MTSGLENRTVVWVLNGISVTTNNGIEIYEECLSESAEDIKNALIDACEVMGSEDLHRGICYGEGLFANKGDITYKEFLEIERECQRQKIIKEATRVEKGLALKRRRSQYSAIRDKLLLQMISAGNDYCCSQDGCCISESLTIDHITPISKGGSDELDNLQFLCRSHNSKKGDR